MGDVLEEKHVRDLVATIGRAGAIHGLVGSEIVKVEDLRQLASQLALGFTAKAVKKDLASQIVRHVDRRITKSLEELQALSRAEISDYLRSTGCDATEVKELLQEASLPVRNKMSLSDLIEFAAIQLDSLGMFRRLSSCDGNSAVRPCSIGN